MESKYKIRRVCDRSMTKIEKICIVCNEKYFVKPSRSRSKYCSYKCTWKARRCNKIKKICPICNTEFFIVPSKLGKRTYCSKKCQNIGNKITLNRPEVKEKIRMKMINRPVSLETKKKQSIAAKIATSKSEVQAKHSIASRRAWKDPIIRAKTMEGLNRPETKIKISGKNAHNWKGGISCEPYCPKWTKEFRNRIRTFYNFECIVCGKSQNENVTKKRKLILLHCHHVEYNKQACCEDGEWRFAALCMSCHSKTRGSKENEFRWKNIINRIIDEIYNGKCYYTKEEYYGDVKK
jgi:hypothetical protein